MSLFDCVYNYFLFRYYKVLRGKNFQCKGRMIIQGHGKYIIGNNVLINSRPDENPIGGYRTVFRTLKNNASIQIGNNVGMSQAILCAAEQIIIEDNVLLGSGCKIFDTDFHSLSYQIRIFQGDNDVKHKPIHVKEGAFIGTDAMILKGVTVGKHSIIGAKAVVTKNVPDNEIWAGNPARKIGNVPD